jgi:hypothetical protein
LRDTASAAHVIAAQANRLFYPITVFTARVPEH